MPAPDVHAGDLTLPQAVLDAISTTLIEEAVELRTLRAEIENYHCAATLVGEILGNLDVDSALLAARLSEVVEDVRPAERAGARRDRVAVAQAQLMCSRQVFHAMVDLAVEHGADEDDVLEAVRKAVEARRTLAKANTPQDLGLV